MAQVGCVNCRISNGYTCIGQPSVCTQVIPPTPSGASLALMGTPSSNTNNVFITLKSTPVFTFPNEVIQREFIKTTITTGFRPTSYCMQRFNQLDLFDCLLVYPSGIPNNVLTILFSFNYQGYSAETRVTVDPLSAVLNGRG